jgi:hypothetical protein
MRSLSEAVARHPEIAQKPLKVQDLVQRFQPSPKNSIDALRIRMGPFKAETDAFRFNNSFPITEENAKQLRQHYEVASDFAVGIGVSQVASVLGGISLNPLPFGPSISLPGAIVDAVITKITNELTGDLVGTLLDKIIAAIPGSFGRCGGMAFAGYDFYQLGWPVDERLGTTPPATGALGDYIFQRLLDSLDLNAGTFLLWLMNLYVMPVISKAATVFLMTAAGSFGGPIGAAIGALIGSQSDIFNLGGSRVLLDDTKGEWNKIKAKLDAEAAWPIGLVYSDSPSPIAQHQVLAIGYSDFGDGTATLKVWDNNDVIQPRFLGLDFRGDELQVSNSDRPLKGFFFENYGPSQPPLSLRLPGILA